MGDSERYDYETLLVEFDDGVCLLTLNRPEKRNAMNPTLGEEITDALSRGDRVELRGFGAFSVKARGARIGRNPRTGESVSVAEKFIPYFKTGKQLREKLNAGS